MKTAETKAVYERECRSRRIVPQDEEGRRWHRALSDYERRDVDAALDAWNSDTTQTSTGRPRGAFLPDPAELKPLVEREVRRRETNAREPRDFVAYQCPECFYRASAFMIRNIARRVDCARCGKPMSEFKREAA